MPSGDSSSAAWPSFRADPPPYDTWVTIEFTGRQVPFVSVLVLALA